MGSHFDVVPADAEQWSKANFFANKNGGGVFSEGEKNPSSKHLQRGGWKTPGGCVVFLIVFLVFWGFGFLSNVFQRISMQSSAFMFDTGRVFFKNARVFLEVLFFLGFKKMSNVPKKNSEVLELRRKTIKIDGYKFRPSSMANL